MAKIEKPKAENPKTVKPQTEKPKTGQPKVEQPKTVRPQTEKPKTGQPKVEQPKTVRPQAEKPKTGQPKVEQPKTVRPQAEKPKTEQPKVEQPKTVRPQAEKPKTETPKFEKQPKTKKEKVEKIVKSPSAFKRPIKEKRFEKKFLKYIEHKQDKKLFTDYFEKQEDKYVIRNNLTKTDVKKIKDLHKWIKKNRKGAIKFVPLVFAGIVAAALIIFFTVFANPLLARATEKGLEAIFEAKSDVRGFRLRLVPLQFYMAGVTVANRDAPMTNLFEMGRVNVQLKTEAVLRGKIYIEEVSAAELRFGTERKTSGTLPARPPKEKPQRERAESDAPPLVDLANFDAQALLEQEFNKLNTPKLYDEAIAAYNEVLIKWQIQIDDAQVEVQRLQSAAQPLMNMNINNMRDVAAIRTAVQDISTMVTTVQSASDKAQNMLGSIEDDINTARKLEQNARNALTSDINHLKSYVDIGSGSAFASLEPFIRDVLSDSAEQYLDYGWRLKRWKN